MKLHGKVAVVTGATKASVGAAHTNSQKRIGNVAYVSKAATNTLTVDMSIELQPHGVWVISLYPGLVRTEKVMEAEPPGFGGIPLRSNPATRGACSFAVQRSPRFYPKTFLLPRLTC